MSYHYLNTLKIRNIMTQDKLEIILSELKVIKTQIKELRIDLNLAKIESRIRGS
jgi:hypothetical protein